MTFVRGIDSWLQCIARVLVSSASKYLDAEDEGQNVRPAEDGDDADAAECLLRQVRRRVVPVQRGLGFRRLIIWDQIFWIRRVVTLGIKIKGELNDY